MTKRISTGGPAFPMDRTSQYSEEGMDLRDWFAGMALSNAYTASEQSPDKAAEWVYQVADAMVAESNKAKQINREIDREEELPY